MWACLALLAALVLVMRDNMAQAQSSRETADLQAQERGHCNVLPDRREQCLLELRLGDQARTQIAQR